MRRLDSLECERAMAELGRLVEEGALTVEDARPAIRALFQRGMSDEAADLFDEHCKSIAKQTTFVYIQVTDLEAGELPYDDNTETPEDEDIDLPFDEDDDNGTL